MSLKSAEDVLKIIPSLFEIDLNKNKDGSLFFEKLSKILEFDNGFIYFLNPNSLQLKYTNTICKNYTFDRFFELDNNLQKEIYSYSGNILNNNSKLIEVLELTQFQNKSYIMSQISIKSAIFGIIILTKKEDNFYNEKDLNILNSASHIFSYVLKDLELSNVFKIQLKALKDGLLEKNAAYKTIKEQNKKILEAEQAKNEFLANISHELRTPLNSILGFSDILSTPACGKLNPKQKEYVNDIKVSATHLLGMINEILDMSKLEANAMKLVKSKFMISRAIDEVCNLVFPLSNKKEIKINKIMDCDFEVMADYQKIQQILYNLTSNAIKFTPENGQIDIIAQKQKNKFQLIIHDNGCGIDPKYHGKIFAKFVQLDSAYTKKESSTGLGLTITKELIELHNGKISLVSKINNGSTFIVEIPQ